MADLINLRSARKKRDRDKKAAIADQNRIDFGTPKLFRKENMAKAAAQSKKLDQHLLMRDKNGDE